MQTELLGQFNQSAVFSPSRTRPGFMPGVSTFNAFQIYWDTFEEQKIYLRIEDSNVPI